MSFPSVIVDFVLVYEVNVPVKVVPCTSSTPFLFHKYAVMISVFCA